MVTIGKVKWVYKPLGAVTLEVNMQHDATNDQQASQMHLCLGNRTQEKHMMSTTKPISCVDWRQSEQPNDRNEPNERNDNAS